ncbi:MAG: tetratricopeptide repeat protein [Verrucomicrobiota bacterium]
MAESTIAQLSAPQREVYQRSKAAMDSSNYGYVITLLKPLLKTAPTFVEGRRLLRAASIQQYKALSKVAKSMLGVKTAAAAMGLSKKDPAETMVACEEVLAIDPYHKGANAKLAEAARKLECLEITALAYETIREGNPKDTLNMHALAEVYMELGLPEKAERTYEAIVEIKPTDGEARSGMKNASAARTSMEGRWDTADNYREILRDEKGSIELEQAARGKQSEESALSQISQLNEQLEAEPENITLMRKIATLYEGIEDFDMAAQWYFYAWDQGKRADNKLEEKYDLMGFRRIEARMAEIHPYVDEDEALAQEHAQLQAERLQKKLEVAVRRVEKYPNDYQYHFELGEAYYLNGNYKDALRPLQTGMKQPSVRARAQTLIGLCHQQRGMLDLAQKTFEGAKAEIPTMDDAKKQITYHLGQVLLGLGKKEEGIEQMKEIYEYDMGYLDVAEIVESSYSDADA